MHRPAAQWAAERLWLPVRLRCGGWAQPIVAGPGFLCWERVCSSLGVWAALVPAAEGAGWGAWSDPLRAPGPRLAGRYPALRGEGEDSTRKARSLPSFGGGGSQGSA